jgi:hypothetical protein
VNVAARIAKSALVIGGLLLAVLYICDYAFVRYKIRHPNLGSALGQVQVYEAARLKNGNFEVFWNQPQTETCVHSLFPQLGQIPCWYASRNNLKIIGAVIFPMPLSLRTP